MDKTPEKRASHIYKYLSIYQLVLLNSINISSHLLIYFIFIFLIDDLNRNNQVLQPWLQAANIITKQNKEKQRFSKHFLPFPSLSFHFISFP
jgi:hypothetical protein